MYYITHMKNHKQLNIYRKQCFIMICIMYCRLKGEIYNLLKLICYLNAPYSLLMPRTAKWSRLPKKNIFNRLKQVISVRKSSLSCSLSACRRRAHGHSAYVCVCVWLPVSPDRRLILCRHRQCRVLG